MSHDMTVILNSGGLRSLVATATVLSRQDHGPVTLLFLNDGRAGAAVRLAHARRQAEHFQLKRVEEAAAPPPAVARRPDSTDAAPPPLWHARLLLTAMAHVMARWPGGRLVWPVQVDGAFDAAARITEQTVLVQHLARIGSDADAQPESEGDSDSDEATSIHVETPLLELTDRQVIELGGQLAVPWWLAWSCHGAGEAPCRSCPACRRREAAFEAAQMIDPPGPSRERRRAV